MSLLSLFTNEKPVTTVTLTFVECITRISQHFDQRKSDDINTAVVLSYVINYFAVADSRQTAVMRDYLSEIATGNRSFEKLSAGEYSHKDIWNIVASTLNQREQKALLHVFGSAKAGLFGDPWDTVKAPIFYEQTLPLEGKKYGQYVFKLSQRNGQPTFKLKISYFYNTVLLPLSVSALYNHCLLELSSDAAREKLHQAMEALLHSIQVTDRYVRLTNMTKVANECFTANGIHI